MTRFEAHTLGTPGVDLNARIIMRAKKERTGGGGEGFRKCLSGKAAWEIRAGKRPRCRSLGMKRLLTCEVSRASCFFFEVGTEGRRFSHHVSHRWTQCFFA